MKHPTLLNCGLALALTLCAGAPLARAAEAGQTPRTSDAVAVIDGRQILRSELEGLTAAAAKEQQRNYEREQKQLRLDFEQAQAQLLESEVNRQVDDRVLALEAAARKTTSAAILADAQAPAVTDAEIQAFYAAQKNQIGQPLEQVAGQIRQLLARESAERTTRQLLDGLRDKYHASVLLEPLRFPIAATGPSRGPGVAPVTIVEFADFQCPFCARMVPVMEQITANYSQQVRVVYRHLPLTSLHPQAAKAAAAGVCAERQGRFWELYTAMFNDQTALTEEALKTKAVSVGMNAKSFADCLDSAQAAATVAGDSQAAEDAGITGVPAFFINGRYVNGAVPYEQLARVIEDELRRQRQAAGGR